MSACIHLHLQAEPALLSSVLLLLCLSCKLEHGACVCLWPSPSAQTSIFARTRKRVCVLRQSVANCYDVQHHCICTVGGRLCPPHPPSHSAAQQYTQAHMHVRTLTHTYAHTCSCAYMHARMLLAAYVSAQPTARARVPPICLAAPIQWHL